MEDEGGRGEQRTEHFEGGWAGGNLGHQAVRKRKENTQEKRKTVQKEKQEKIKEKHCEIGSQSKRCLVTPGFVPSNTPHKSYPVHTCDPSQE